MTCWPVAPQVEGWNCGGWRRQRPRGMRQVGVKSDDRATAASLATAMKRSPLHSLLAVVCGLLLLQGAHSTQGSASVRSICIQSDGLPTPLRGFCNWLYSSEEGLPVRRAPAQQLFKVPRRFMAEAAELEPVEPPVVPRQDRYSQEPSSWETIKRQDNNHMFLRFGRRRK
ncbi:uncharacterized protein LOC135944078 [Cloeon dipterum]|uniref:uncharacterized protein LOC135944078 n=1 Tax=Cloeon dipterum TaxID=197152 RepID=UPI00321FE467